MRSAVLHLQKVAGISGSEAHLLSLLPDLRSRGWEIRLLMLHEDEPGAWDFARELETRGIPVDAIHLSADVDPLAFARVSSHLASARPTITPSWCSGGTRRPPKSLILKRTGVEARGGASSCRSAGGMSPAPDLYSFRPAPCPARTRRRR